MSTALASQPSTPKPASPFRDRNFLLLWLAQLISSLGDWAIGIAIPVTVYNATHSKTALGFAAMAGAVPILAFGLIAGTLVDRWDRRRIMIISDLGRAVTVLMLLGIRDFHRITAFDIGLFYGSCFLIAAFSCFFMPARNALLAALMPDEKLLQANATSQSSLQIVQLVGPALGGLLLQLLHPRGILVFDSVSFALSALCVAFVASSALTASEAVGETTGIWQATTDGLRYFRQNRLLVSLIGVMSVATLGMGVFNTLEYAFVKDIWHAGSTQYGFLMSVAGLGMLVGGGLLAGPFRAAPPLRLILIGFSLMAVGVLLIACTPTMAFGGIFLFVTGGANMIVNLPAATLFQTLVPNALQGRVYSTCSIISGVVGASAGGVAAGLAHLLPLQLLFASLAITYLLCALLIRPLLGRQESPTTAANSIPDVVLEPTARPAKS